MKERRDGILKDVKDIILSLLLAVVSSLVLILIFGIVLKFSQPNDIVVTIVNEIIKILSMLLGICLMCKNNRQVFLKGAIVGALYYFIIFLIAGGINGDMAFKLVNVAELAVACFAGIVSNIINTSVRIKRDR